jgi:very-short-patch-repair endonuclease
MDGRFLTVRLTRQKRTMKLNALPELKTFRKELRASLTPAEAALWKMLKSSQLDGRKFRRQHSVEFYILDFYCPMERLAVELDGQVHMSGKAQQYDHERTLFLEFYKIKVIRFENKVVFEEPAWVLDQIRSQFGWRTKYLK